MHPTQGINRRGKKITDNDVLEKGKKRRENSSRDGKISVSRGKERERGECGREEFSSQRKPFSWRGDPRRERKTAREREREREREGEREKERDKERDKERERRKERERGELLS